MPGHRWLYRNSLSLVLAGIFLVLLVGQSLTGWSAWNDERVASGAVPLGWAAYLRSGHFISATFENWESEFLQIAMYVLLTVWLRQAGSAESRPLDEREETERIDPGPAPSALSRGPLLRWLYAHSLSIALLSLFVLSFALHAHGSTAHENEERVLRGQPVIAMADHLQSATFWFESFQNWQSEFLAVLALVLLSIWLRQDKSPESKPLRAPHAQTGK